MKIQILFFGITTDLTGVKSLGLEIATKTSVKNLKDVLAENYIGLKNLHQFAIAVNEEYADDALILKENDVVAIIPPVSGG